MPRITRRHMIQASAAIGTATALPAVAAEGVAKNGRIKHSICSWCFTARGEKWSFEKVCEVAKSLGAILLRVQINPAADVSDDRQLPADQQRDRDEPNPQEGRVDVEDIAQGRAYAGDLLVAAVE